MFGTSLEDVVVVAAAFGINAFTMGQVKSIGPFFIELQQDFSASAQQSSLFMSLLYGSFFASGPFASTLSNRFGFRNTLIAGGIFAGLGAIICSGAKYLPIVYVASLMMGVGCGLSTVPTFAILGMRFQEKRHLANNITTMGSALLAIPLSPLVQLWIDEYTWRGAILLLGALFLNIIPNALLITRNPGVAKKREWRLSDLKIMKSVSFSCYMIVSGADLAAMVCVSVYLVRYTQSKGIDYYLAASLSSLMAIVDLCLRPISGYLVSLSHIGRVKVVRPYVFAGIAVIQACVVASYTLCDNIYGIIAVTVAYAVCIGCRGALSVTLMTEFFGTKTIVTALGLRSLSLGIFSATIPPVVGRIVDATGSYRSPFYASGMLSLLSAVGVLVVKKTAPNIQTESTTNEIDNKCVSNEEADNDDEV